MTEERRGGMLRGLVIRSILFGCIAGFCAEGRAQAAVVVPTRPSAPVVQALLVSDIHFEPFWDPGKAERLKTAPVGDWSAILAEPETADREAKFEELQQTCHARGADTSYALYESSLQAMRVEAGGAKFVVLSGDLISHDFDCKFATLLPKAGPGDYRAFVEKTIEFVLRNLRGALPGVPLYAALGNNDSGCGDYKLDTDSPFLAAMADEFTRGLIGADREQAARTFAEGGYYSARLPAPLDRTRILVLDDIFMSRRYETCGGKADPAAAAAQTAWLEQQLDAARRSHEKAWVMSHIPPGVDPFSTATKSGDICSGGKPQMFLSSEALPKAMAGYGDVIRLAVFAHTHMDEVRLLRPMAAGAPPEGVALKMVPSISPIDGNNPAFTVAQIDAATAEMKDYRVYVASNKTGVDARWSEEYDFAQAYKQPAFSPAALKGLIAGFEADRKVQTDASQSYIHNYGAGFGTRELNLFWPEYACALENDGAGAFKGCVCQGHGTGSSQ